ncbi:M48 family metalloprotease [Longispora albida]|uniref:M48 family metalloprotease n=1 Tax=Longispora albida TaxID=203523 RepID=UPI00035F4247|nr:M48 family metalloprotease [Longispora albida]
MIPAGPEPALVPAGPGLDERVLSAGTTQRFALLLVLFVAVTAGAAHVLAGQLAGGNSAARAGLTLAATVAVAACAVAVYYRLPRWKATRARFVPLARITDGGQLSREVDELVKLSGLPVVPEFVVDPAAAGVGALVFGTGKQPVVCLNAGLLVTRAAHPGRFRAIVLHELAHVHNGDVGITYATVALWRVLIACVLVPELLVIAAGWATGGVVPVRWLIAHLLLVPLVYLTRADILRARELYADRTAARLGRLRPGALLPGTSAARPPHRLAGLAEVWRTHPSWRMRARSLVEPDALFAVSGARLLVTGLTAGMATTQLAAPFEASGPWVRMAQYLLIAGLVAGIGGVALWRSTVHAVLTGRRVPSGWVAGIWLGSGVAAGQAAHGLDISRLRISQVCALAFLVVVTGLLMAWTTQFAELRVRTYRGESLNTAMAGGLVPPALALAFVLLWWNADAWIEGWSFSADEALTGARLPASGAPFLLRFTATLTALPGSDLSLAGLWWAVPLLWLAPLQLWLSRLPRDSARLGEAARRAAERYPLLWLLLVGLVFAAYCCGTLWLVNSGPAGYLGLVLLGWLAAVALWRYRRAVVSRRSWLDDARPASPPLRSGAPPLRRVLLVGAGCGVLSWAGLLAAPEAVASAHALGSWQVNGIAALGWVVIVTGVATALSATVAGCSPRDRYPVLTSFIAAGLTATIGVAGQLVKGVLDGCLGPLNELTAQCGWHPARFLPVAEYAYGYVAGPVLVLAALLGAAASACARAVRKHRGTPEDLESVLAQRRAGTALVNTLAVCLLGGTTLHQTLTMEAPLPRPTLLYAYQVHPTAILDKGLSPDADWMRHTADIFRRIASAYRDLAAAEEATDFALVRAPLQRACAALTDIGLNAEPIGRLYQPALAAEADRHWARFASGVRQTAAHCPGLLAATTTAEVRTRIDALKGGLGPVAKAAWEVCDWGRRRAGRSDQCPKPP